MNWLALDTSMNACAVGIRRADGAFFEKTEYIKRGLSERVLPLILELCEQAGLSLKDMDAYAVTCGPGTFTGLRIGLSAIRALAQASGKPAIGVNTFDALAASVDTRPLCVLIETKRTDYYTRLYTQDGPQGPGACLLAGDIAAMLPAGATILGDATQRIANETKITNPVIELLSPSLEHIIKIAAAKSLDKINLPEPEYLRQADVSCMRHKVAKII